MLPVDRFGQPGGFDTILPGVAGWEDIVPGPVSLRKSLLQCHRRFNRHITLRPVKLIAGTPSPLTSKKPGDIDFPIVRENTEGEYPPGSRIFDSTERKVVIQESVFIHAAIFSGVDTLSECAGVQGVNLLDGLFTAKRPHQRP